MRTLFAGALVLLLAMSVAAESDSKEQVKDAAREACVAAAVKRYGDGTAKQKAYRKKIGKVKGYAFRMRVGARKKEVNCLADAKGEAIFFRGQI